MTNTTDKELEKAYGGCRKCYGKGYASELTGYTAHPDFIGDKKVKWSQSNMVICSCQRGRDLDSCLDYLISQAKQETLERVLDEVIGEDEMSTVMAGEDSEDFPKKTDERIRNKLRQELRTKLMEIDI